jgi:hypothetical protein
MRPVYWRAALCGVALAAVAACDDDGVGLDGGEGEERGGGQLMAPASMDRFEVQVRAGGAFRPGQPIQITVTGKANLRTGDAVVQLVLPEVAAARRAGWARLDYGHDGEADAEFADRQPMARGQSLTRTASIIIPRPGYYQVVATIRKQTEDATDEQPAGGELVQNVAHDEIWIWVSESGGRATDTFEPGRIPESMHRVPGPLTPLSEAPATTLPGTPRTGPRPSRAPAGRPRASHAPWAGWVDLHVMYWNNDARALRPIPNARYEFLIYNRLGTYIRTEPSGTTDATGLAIVQCYSDANGYGKYKLRVYLDSDRVTMQEQLALDTQPRDFATTCGTVANEQTIMGTLPKERSHVFTNLDRAIRTGDAFFGRQRRDITVHLDPTRTWSTYEWGTATTRLLIATQVTETFGDQIWGTFGAFVQAHEYGHAYQDDVLGGVQRYYVKPDNSAVCPVEHPMHAQTNLQCALAEAFADYYAVSAIPGGTGVVESEMEHGRYSPSPTNQWGYRAGTNGSIIQGAVASFLYDITDPANETHDQTQYPGTWVAEIIRTCQVYTGTWKFNDGIDHLVYCFQGVVHDTGYFSTRSPHPTSHITSAPEPEPYNTRYFKIRKNFMKNLFGYDV